MFRKKRTWIFLILAIAALWGGYVLFYKSTPKNIATNTADAVVVIDVKRVLQTGIWEYITHPSRWKIDWSTDDSKDTLVNWKDAIRLPDYVTLFHEKGQDWGIWNTQLLIKDEADFLRFMQQNKFESLRPNIFKSDSLKITITKDANRIFVSSSNELNVVSAIHQRLITDKEDVNAEVLSHLKAQNKHINFYFAKGNTLQGDAYAHLHYSNNIIELKGNATPIAPYFFNNITYTAPKDDMLFVILAQPKFDLTALLDSSALTKFKNIINVSAESTLLTSNQSYAIHLQKFAEKIDTALSYTYDDDFNAIEKKEITKNIEPVFGIEIKGPKADSILMSWRQQKVIEKNSKGELFTSIPFAKSYCVAGKNKLAIVTPDFNTPGAADSRSQLMHILVDAKKLYPNIEKYLPTNFQDIVRKINNIEMQAQLADKNTVNLTGSIEVDIW